MKVIVTKKDIKLGQPELTDSCPIALALKRKHLGKPSVESDYFTVTVRGEERRFDLPDNAKLFVENFDEGYDVEPFTFTAEESPVIDGTYA